MTDPRTFHSLTGPDLAALRREAGLTQAELARRAGIGRQTVISWEKKPSINPSVWVPQRMLEALQVRVVGPPALCSRTTTRARGDGVLVQNDPYSAEVLNRDHKRLALMATAQVVRGQVLCGATTRKGHSCRLLSEPGRDRCKFHGGMSTGPKTAEGRARIAEAQRRRWAAWGAARREQRPGH